MKQTQTCLKPMFFKWLPVGGCTCKHLQSYSRFLGDIISTLLKSCPLHRTTLFFGTRENLIQWSVSCYFTYNCLIYARTFAITEQAGLHSLCFSLMMEEHPCTYWIAHKALKGYPTKILSPCEGS